MATIVFSTDDEIVKSSVGQITNEQDVNLKYKTPQPVKGGLYDTNIFGSVGKCSCGAVTAGRCPFCNDIVYDESTYMRNHAYYLLHSAFILDIKLPGLILKLEKLGIKMPRLDKNKLKNIWSLVFDIVPADKDHVVNQVSRIFKQRGEVVLKDYDIKNDKGEAFKLNIYELQEYSDIAYVGPNGLFKLSYYNTDSGTSLSFIRAHVNSVLTITSPGLREISYREVGSNRIVKDLPDICFNYKAIIYADRFINTVLSTTNYNAVDVATAYYLMNNLYDKHVQSTDMLATSKESTFRKNIKSRVGSSMRGNAISYKGALVDEIYLPRAMAYHALQGQIIARLVNEYNTQDYDALRMYKNLEPAAISAMEDVINESQVLMCRNPTLHRNNLVQFTPKLWPDDNTPAIGVNPYACKMYNLDFDGDQIAIYFITDKKDLMKLGTKLRADNLWVFDKNHKPTYLPSSTTVYGLYCATTVNHKSNPKKYDRFESMESDYSNDRLEFDDEVILLPNKSTTYGREKISKIIGTDLDNVIGDKQLDMSGVTKIILGLQNKPNRTVILNEFRDFGDEIATIVGIDTLPLKNLYKGFSPKIEAIANDPDISEDLKISKIMAIMPKELDKALKSVPDTNMEILMKGSRIDADTLKTLYTPYVRYGADGKVKVGDSSVISGMSEEEYINTIHSQRKILEIKSSSVPRAGYNRTQLVLVSMHMTYSVENSENTSYIYMDKDLANKDKRTLCLEAPAPKYPDLVAVYSTATNDDKVVYSNQVSDYTRSITEDKAVIGITYADAISESFYQAELKLKYGGLLNQFTGENVIALEDGDIKSVTDETITIGKWTYQLGKNIVPSEEIIKRKSIKKGDTIAVNVNLVSLDKRFSSFYTIFDLVSSGVKDQVRKSQKNFYLPTGVSYAPFDGYIHYHDGFLYIDNTKIEQISEGVTYFYPESYKVHYGDRISSLTLSLKNLLKFCDKEYAAYIFYKEMCRISGDKSNKPSAVNTDMSEVLFKVLINADFSVKTKMKHQEDFVTRQLYGATAKGLKDAVKAQINEGKLDTEIEMNNDNPILKLLIRGLGDGEASE